MLEMTFETLVLTLLLFTHVARCNIIIPADKTQLNKWFHSTVSSRTSSSLHPSLSAAEAHPSSLIRVMARGGGDFKKIADAVKSVPDGNKKRVVIFIGPGNYTEKIFIPITKPFITFHGDIHHPPVLVYGDTAAKNETFGSATLNVESDYFSAFNLKVVNSAPRPDGHREDAQAVAMRISGNMTSFYNCRFHGYQDTLLDDNGGWHFFKDCYIEGTVDFIFGNGKSIYLNTEIHVIPGNKMAIITAQGAAKEKKKKQENTEATITAQGRTNKKQENTGYVFVHCNVTGGGPGVAYLGRTWGTSPRVVFAYSYLGDVVNKDGWSDNQNPSTDRTVFFGEYKNTGPGSSARRPVAYAKGLTDAGVKPFINLDFVEGSKWLVPPPRACGV